VLSKVVENQMYLIKMKKALLHCKTVFGKFSSALSRKPGVFLLQAG